MSVKSCRTTFAVNPVRAHVRRPGDGAPEAAAKTGERPEIRTRGGKGRETDEVQVGDQEEMQETILQNSRR